MDDLSSYIILPINTQFLPNVVSGTHINESDNGSSNDKMFANIEYYVSPSSEIENVYVNSSEMQSGHFVSNGFVDNNELNDITYKCSVCETIFNKYDLYLVHLQSHRSNTAFQCKKCNKTFDHVNAFHKHIMEHQEDKPFRCLICQAGFNIENNFKVHMALHGNSSQCPICEISFQRMASLKSHLAIHQVEELHICSECSSEFETMTDLKKHIKTHFLDVVDQHRDLTCNICKVKFETSIALKDHISSHLKVKKIVLNGKRTNKNQMGKKEYKHKCSICNKTFPKLSLLERHTRIHSGERPYVCSICEKGFTQKGTLQIHMTKHSGLKPFCCTLCPAKFNQKCNLKVHVQKTHTATTEDEKIFKCSQCDCIFKKIASLNGHMTKIHATDATEISIASIDHPNNIDKRLLGNISDASNSNIPQSSENQLEMNIGEKLTDGGKISKIYSLKQKCLGTTKVYICSYCDKEIKKPSDLIRHLRTHTKEKPFKCFCGNSFSVKSTLLTHMQIHKGNNGKKCSICSKKLFTMKAWNAHLRKHGSSSQTFSTIQNWQVLDETGKHSNPSVKCLDGPQRLVSVLKKVNMKRNIHSVDRKYKCRVCQRSFITPLSVKEHMKLHSDVRNFECETCNKMFATKSLLKRHMSIHNTQKPYECFYCRRKFKNILMCGRHIKTHENNDAKQDILKASLSYVDDEVSVANTAVNVSDSMTLLEVNPDEILDNLFDSESKKTNQESSNVAVTENLEKFATTSSTTPLELEKSTELQTFFVECPTDVHVEEELTNNFFSHLDLQPNNIIDQEAVSEMQDSPMIFNVQNLIGEGTFPAVDIMNGELYMNNSSAHTDFQETKTLYTNVQNIMSSALNNSICMPNDISDNFLANNMSLYPNTHIEFDKSEEITATIPSTLSAPQEDTCLDDTENLEKNTVEDSNIITVSFEESGGTTGNLNIVHCSKCKGLFDNMTTYDSHTCLKPVLKNNSLDEFVDLDKSMNISAKFHDNKNILKNNSKSHKSVKKDFSCVYCGREFHSRGAYIRHANTHKKNDDGLHKCKFCIKKFKKPSDLSRHLRTHTGEKPFACDKCDKKFSLKSTLEGHYRTHNPGATKDFLCEVCNSFFTSKSSLKIHMHVHTGMKPHKCNYCDQHFRTLAHRRSHEQKMHSDGSKNNQNKLNISVDHSKLESIIEKNQNSEIQEIPEQTQMKMHLSEEGTQPLSDTIQIDEALLQQLQNSNIIIEVLHDIDPKEQSSVISIDENTLENLGLLTARNKQFSELPADDGMQIESERNLECEICHKKYASKDVFRKHMQLHSKKKFICDLCNKWFSTVEALCEHEKLHSGHRPYPCFLCSNNFAELQHLKSHLRRIHQIEDTSQLILKV